MILTQAQLQAIVNAPRVSEQMSVINVKSFGAIGDGQVDDTLAVQDALNLAKGLPGSGVYFPRGRYLITTSLDVTYDGGIDGILSPYYGFSMFGDDRHNSILIGQTSGTVLLDLTGKSRMTISNLGLVNSTDTPNNSSAAMLIARNTTNTNAGDHSFAHVNFTGYFDTTVVQSASSESNCWTDCQFETFVDDGSCFELTEQILNGINSEYIDLSSHTFAGGNTNTSMTHCTFTNSGTFDKPCIVIEGSENVTFIAGYSFNNDGPAIKLTGVNSSILFLNHRDESVGNWMMEIDAAANVLGLHFTGRGSRGIIAGDNSVIARSIINPSFLATDSSFSFDVYDFTESSLSFVTVGARVRNSARGSVFTGVQLASELTMPTDPDKAPRETRISQPGDIVEYRKDATALDQLFENTVTINDLTVLDSFVSPP